MSMPSTENTNASSFQMKLIGRRQAGEWMPYNHDIEFQSLELVCRVNDYITEVGLVE